MQVHGFTVLASAWLYSTCKCTALQYMQVHSFPRKFMALYLQINKALYIKVHGLTSNFMDLLASSWPYLQVSSTLFQVAQVSFSCTGKTTPICRIFNAYTLDYIFTSIAGFFYVYLPDYICTVYLR